MKRKTFMPFRNERHWAITQLPPKERKKLIKGRAQSPCRLNRLIPEVNSQKPEISQIQGSETGKIKVKIRLMRLKKIIKPQIDKTEATLWVTA